jgi:hypothetical protein
VVAITETQNPQGPDAVPQVTSYGSAVDGAFELTATCAANSYRYVLEGSTDLEQWTKVQVRTNATGTIEFRDALATNRPLRFYRVVAP